MSMRNILCDEYDIAGDIIDGAAVRIFSFMYKLSIDTDKEYWAKQMAFCLQVGICVENALLKWRRIDSALMSKLTYCTGERKEIPFWKMAVMYNNVVSGAIAVGLLKDTIRDRDVDWNVSGGKIEGGGKAFDRDYEVLGNYGSEADGNLYRLVIYDAKDFSDMIGVPETGYICIISLNEHWYTGWVNDICTIGSITSGAIRSLDSVIEEIDISATESIIKGSTGLQFVLSKDRTEIVAIRHWKSEYKLSEEEKKMATRSILGFTGFYLGKTINITNDTSTIKAYIQSCINDEEHYRIVYKEEGGERVMELEYVEGVGVEK